MDERCVTKLHEDSDTLQGPCPAVVFPYENPEPYVAKQSRAQKVYDALWDAEKQIREARGSLPSVERRVEELVELQAEARRKRLVEESEVKVVRGEVVLHPVKREVFKRG